VEMEQLVEELCHEVKKKNEHEGVELEFDQEDSVGSLLLESLTDNDDDDDDEEDEEDDEEENARLLQMATLQSENEAFQTSINKLHEDVAQLTKERNTAMQNDFKGRSCVSHDISLNDSFEDLTSSSHLTTMELYKTLRVEKDELQRTLLEIRKANEDLGKLLLKKEGALEEACCDEKGGRVCEVAITRGSDGAS